MRIDISTNANEFTIKVENSIEEGAEDIKRPNGGLGLENVIRRLALIYPNKHEINTYKEANSFLVVLKIITNWWLTVA